MAEMNKIQSFKTFSQLKAEEKQQQIQEEQQAKRNETATKIAEILAEMEVTSLTELSEEQRKQLVAKLFNEDTAEDIEDKIEDMGEPKPADEEEGEELEADMSEGNAFIYAAAKAKAEGKDSFEFNGKSYKVTLKKDTGLKESVQLLITEATRWQFGIIDKSGKIQSNYVHYDGYPSSVIPEIQGMDAKDVKKILKDSEMGGMSSLGDFYNNSKESTISTGDVKKIKNYLKEVGNEAGAEYVYLYDERDGQWYGADVYTDKALKPVEQLDESVVNEGVKLNGESDAGKAKLAEKEFGHLLPADFKFANVTTSGGRKRLAIKYKGKPAFEFSTGLDRGIAKTKQLDKAWVESGINYIKKYVAESTVNEAEVKSDAEFEEYAMTVLKKAFGEDFDESKAKEVIDGLKSKYSGDYGAMVGALQSSLD